MVFGWVLKDASLDGASVCSNSWGLLSPLNSFDFSYLRADSRPWFTCQWDFVLRVFRLGSKLELALAM